MRTSANPQGRGARSFRRGRVALVAALGLAAASVAGLESTAGAAAVRPTSRIVPFSVQASCAAAKPGFASCFALRVIGSQHLSVQATGPAGYHPADLKSAYNLPSTGGTGQTVGIVDAYNDPDAASNLAVYRKEFGLPACTTANGCFRKVSETGTKTYPKNNSGWSEEISLDLDMVSAICPSCHILLVEATTSSLANLGKSVDEAVKLGATEVSNSYGGSETKNEATFAADYDHPGVPITVSAGDSGYQAGAQNPAVYNTVTAVGGTSLKKSSSASRGWTETVWDTSSTEATGSGCSKYIAKPSWQKDTGCTFRTVGDVAADADPATGVSVYDTDGGVGGWLVFGGTSVASPLIAAVYALAGNGASIDNASYTYAHTSKLYDVTSGSNGSCGGSYLCTAKVGYDGPTGNGTPNGTGAF
jgi:subtilase family serine protease